MHVFFAAAMMASLANHQSITVDEVDSLNRPFAEFQRTVEFKILEDAMEEDYFVDWRDTKTCYMGDSLSYNYVNSNKKEERA